MLAYTSVSVSENSSLDFEHYDINSTKQFIVDSFQ